MRKRRLTNLITIALIASLVLTSSIAFGSTTVSRGTGTAYTHSDKFEDSVVICGVDLSEWQGKIDWNLMKLSGVDFAILRLGGTSYSDGHFYRDSNFEKYYLGATSVGIKVGAYFYSQATNEKEAENEVEFALKVLAGRKLDMPLFLDYEGGGTESSWFNSADLTKKEGTKVAIAFMEAVRRAGYEPGFYSYLYFVKGSNAKVDGQALSKEYPMWIANYNTYCAYTGDYEIWQYSSSGKLRGTQGSTCDLNYYYVEPYSNFDLSKEIQNRRNIAASNIEVCDYTLTYIYREDGGYEPRPVVTYGDKKLEYGKDYDLEYYGNYNFGEAYVKVIGKGDYYGYKFASFNIYSNPDPSNLIIKDSYELTYTGNPVKETSINILEPIGNRITGYLDYNFVNFKATNVGTYNVTIKLDGNYTGTLKTKIVIKKGAQTISLGKSYTTIYTDTKPYNLGASTKYSGSKITYKSSNTKVATVSSTGVITPKGKGTTTITINASGTGNFNKATKTFKLTVTTRPEKEKPTRVDLSQFKGKDRLITHFGRKYIDRNITL